MSTSNVIETQPSELAAPMSHEQRVMLVMRLIYSSLREQGNIYCQIQLAAEEEQIRNSKAQASSYRSFVTTALLVSSVVASGALVAASAYPYMKNSDPCAGAMRMKRLPKIFDMLDKGSLDERFFKEVLPKGLETVKGGVDTGHQIKRNFDDAGRVGFDTDGKIAAGRSGDALSKMRGKETEVAETLRAMREAAQGQESAKQSLTR